MDHYCRDFGFGDYVLSAQAGLAEQEADAVDLVVVERVRQLEGEIKQKLQRRLARPWREGLQELIVPDEAA